MGKKTTNSTKPAEPEKRAAKVTPPAEPEPAPASAPAPAKPAKPKAGAKPKAKPATKPVKTKPAAKAVAKPAPKAPKAAAKKGKKSAFLHDTVALRAYFIAEKRQATGMPGNAHLDWVEAERQLAAEARAAKKKAK